MYIMHIYNLIYKYILFILEVASLFLIIIYKNNGLIYNNKNKTANLKL